MKNFFKVLTLGMFLAMFAAVNVTTTFAQDEQAKKEATYKKYTDNYNVATIEAKKTAIAAAKEYIQTYTDEVDKDIVAYLKGAIPQLEDWIKKEEIRLDKVKKFEAEQARNNRFDKAYKAEVAKKDASQRNWAETFAAGADILKYKPNFYDISLVLASIGFDEASKAKPNNQFNNEAIKYAKDAINKMNNGVASTTKNYGAYAYEYKTKNHPDGKSNALGWMNYTIGYIKYFRQNKEEEALPYFYKATQLNSETKDFSLIYKEIGRWYLNKVVEMEKVRNAKLTEAKNEDTPETIALLAKNKGYAQRAIDGYARAYNLAKANPNATKAYKDSLYAKLKQLYDFRYDEAMMKSEAKINSDVATIMSKPMPNPSSPVQPIEKPKPAVDSTTTDASTNGVKRARTVANKPDNR